MITSPYYWGGIERKGYVSSMMNAHTGVRLGDFTIFGFTKEPEHLLKRRLSERLGITPLTRDFGNAGQFFFYTSCGDVAETEQALALKLGFARTPAKSPLSALHLLDQRIATPQDIDHDVLRGNALVACFSKTEAQFVAYKNLLSLPQLYYWASNGEFIGADNLRCLVDVLDQVVLNEDVIPFHFTFRHAPGTQTYFRDVHRLFPGQHLRWREGRLDVHRVQDLRFPDGARAFERVEPGSVARLYQELQDVVGATIRDIEESGQGLGNLLSGGVDSSVLQLIINERLSSRPARSFSFAPVRTPSFEFEIEYARQASEIFETEHTFVRFAPEDYPDLVCRAVDTLGQPVLSDVEPCKLALAEFLREHAPDQRFFFVAQGADTLFGLGIAQKIKLLELLGKVPGSRLALAGAGMLLKPFTERGQTLLKGAQILARPHDPHLFVAPINTIAVFFDPDVVRRAFGDQVVRRVLAYRRDLETQYLNSADYTERVHVVDLLGDTYEIEVQSGQLFLANGKEQIYPFMDDDIVRISMAFRPEVRYIEGWRTKPLLKDILVQHGLSVIARKPKGGSVFTDDLYAWMRSGPLHEMVRDIDRPGFLSRAEFGRLIENPDHFTWSLLTFDVFQKRILNHDSKA
jgi:asparagine synthetase B (glutamine-hydrolysing)